MCQCRAGLSPILMARHGTHAASRVQRRTLQVAPHYYLNNTQPLVPIQGQLPPHCNQTVTMDCVGWLALTRTGATRTKPCPREHSCNRSPGALRRRLCVLVLRFTSFRGVRVCALRGCVPPAAPPCLLLPLVPSLLRTTCPLQWRPVPTARTPPTLPSTFSAWVSGYQRYVRVRVCVPVCVCASVRVHFCGLGVHFACVR